MYDVRRRAGAVGHCGAGDVSVHAALLRRARPEDAVRHHCEGQGASENELEQFLIRDAFSRSGWKLRGWRRTHFWTDHLAENWITIAAPESFGRAHSWTSDVLCCRLGFYEFIAQRAKRAEAPRRSYSTAGARAFTVARTPGHVAARRLSQKSEAPLAIRPSAIFGSLQFAPSVLVPRCKKRRRTRTGCPRATRPRASALSRELKALHLSGLNIFQCSSSHGNMSLAPFFEGP